MVTNRTTRKIREQPKQTDSLGQGMSIAPEKVLERTSNVQIKTIPTSTTKGSTYTDSLGQGMSIAPEKARQASLTDSTIPSVKSEANLVETAADVAVDLIDTATFQQGNIKRAYEATKKPKETARSFIETGAGVLGLASEGYTKLAEQTQTDYSKGLMKKAKDYDTEAYKKAQATAIDAYEEYYLKAGQEKGGDIGALVAGITVVAPGATATPLFQKEAFLYIQTEVSKQLAKDFPTLTPGEIRDLAKTITKTRLAGTAGGETLTTIVASEFAGESLGRAGVKASEKFLAPKIAKYAPKIISKSPAKTKFLSSLPGFVPGGAAEGLVTYVAETGSRRKPVSLTEAAIWTGAGAAIAPPIGSFIYAAPLIKGTGIKAKVGRGAGKVAKLTVDILDPGESPADKFTDIVISRNFLGFSAPKTTKAIGKAGKKVVSTAKKTASKLKGPPKAIYTEVLPRRTFFPSVLMSNKQPSIYSPISGEAFSAIQSQIKQRQKEAQKTRSKTKEKTKAELKIIEDIFSKIQDSGIGTGTNVFAPTPNVTENLFSLTDEQSSEQQEQQEEVKEGLGIGEQISENIPVSVFGAGGALPFMLFPPASEGIGTKKRGKRLTFTPEIKQAQKLTAGLVGSGIGFGLPQRKRTKKTKTQRKIIKRQKLRRNFLTGLF